MEMYRKDRRDEISHCAHQWWWYDRDCLADWTKECDKTYDHWDDVFNKDYEIFSNKEEDLSQSLLELPSRKKEIVPPPEQCYSSLANPNEANYRNPCLKSWKMFWDACRAQD